VNSTLYQEPDDEAGAMKVSDFEMKGKTGVFPKFHQLSKGGKIV
jgi:hypothetical protein